MKWSLDFASFYSNDSLIHKKRIHELMDLPILVFSSKAARIGILFNFGCTQQFTSKGEPIISSKVKQTGWKSDTALFSCQLFKSFLPSASPTSCHLRNQLFTNVPDRRARSRPIFASKSNRSFASATVWHEKKRPYFLLNPGCLIGIPIMVCYSQKNWVGFHPYIS